MLNDLITTLRSILSNKKFGYLGAIKDKIRGGQAIKIVALKHRL